MWSNWNSCTLSHPLPLHQIPGSRTWKDIYCNQEGRAATHVWLTQLKRPYRAAVKSMGFRAGWAEWTSTIYEPLQCQFDPVLFLSTGLTSLLLHTSSSTYYVPTWRPWSCYCYNCNISRWSYWTFLNSTSLLGLWLPPLRGCIRSLSVLSLWEQEMSLTIQASSS